MKVKTMLFAGGCLGLLLAGHVALGQARLVLNGARLRMEGGAVLVVQNASPQALTRYDGHIISEGEHNRVKWVTGTTTGLYTVPWGLPSGAYLPLRFTKEAGSGDGFFLLSTYATPWRNSDVLPEGVTNFNGGSGDESARAVDRFWQISAQGYNEKPALANLQFTYRDEEAAAPNTISEEALRALHWNETAGAGWDKTLVGTVDVGDHSVVVPEVPSADLFAWWTLIDGSFTALPLTGLSFDARLQGGDVHLHWTTLSEERNERFIIERSSGLSFLPIGTLPGRGTTSERSTYRYVDQGLRAGVYYYRLKQSDAGGRFSYSAVRRVEVTSKDHPPYTVYPNPAIGYTYLYATSGVPEPVGVQLVDNSGKVVAQQTLVLGAGAEARLDLSFCRPGMYFIRILAAGRNHTQAIVVY